jgi:hypothetical protein
MNAAPDYQPWSRRKWLALIAACFAAHVGLIALLGARPTPPPAPPKPFRAALTESLAPWVAHHPDYEDPALFALPSHQGFSGIGWLRIPTESHQYHEWSEEQRWLAFASENMGETFVQYVRDLTGRPLALTEKQSPVLIAPNIPAAADWLRKNSSLRVEGPLAGRRLLVTPVLPVWPHSDVLDHTVAQAMVDQRGWVIAVTLLEESGLPAADRFALEAVRELMFEKSATPGLTSGKLVFEWQTSPATNGHGSVTAP